MINGTGTIVDWVYVELRSTILPNSIVAQRAGFFKTNGSIVDTDGVTPLVFENDIVGNYYVVVFLDGYLPLMSAAPVAFSSGSTATLNLLSASNVYGSIDGYRILSSDVVLAGGDLNYDGNIDTLDLPELQDDSDNSVYGYVKTDFNKDFITDAFDYTFWSNNSDDFKASQFSFR